MRTMRTLAIIPAFNSEGTIGDIVTRALKYADEVIVVDDGSTDGTPGMLARLGARKACTVLTNKKNRGKGEALRRALALLKRAGRKRRPDAIIFLDSDGEHNPEDIPRFISALEHADIVLGRRASHRSPARHLLNAWMTLWFRLLAREIDDPSCGFRCARWSLLERLELNSSGFSIDAEIILEGVKAGATFHTVALSQAGHHATSVRRADYLDINKFFDEWVLKNANHLNLSAQRRLTLLAGASVGKALVTLLNRRRA